MRIPLGFLLTSVFVGCGGEPGACIEVFSAEGSSTADSWCLDVESADRCPVNQTHEEFRWEWSPGETCEGLGFQFDCGDSIWEDIETQC